MCVWVGEYLMGRASCKRWSIALPSTYYLNTAPHIQHTTPHQQPPLPATPTGLEPSGEWASGVLRDFLDLRLGLAALEVCKYYICVFAIYLYLFECVDARVWLAATCLSNQPP